MSIVYADTSAVLKRTQAESESGAVREVFDQLYRDGDLIVASSLTWLEVWRALRRLQRNDVAEGTRLAMSGIDEFPLDDGVIHGARRVGGDRLRLLDSIHLASAVMVGAHSMLTFDARLAEAAESAGMLVLRP